MFNVSEEKQQTMAGKGHFIRLKPVIFAWFLLIVKTYNLQGDFSVYNEHLVSLVISEQSIAGTSCSGVQCLQQLITRDKRQLWL